MIYLGNYSYMIGIPSRSRSHLIERHQGIWRYINPDRHNAKLFVRASETTAYRSCAKVPVISMPDSYKICDKRQAMLEYASDDEHEFEFLFIIDDDIVLYHRDETVATKYSSAIEGSLANDSFTKILEESMKLCSEQFPIVGAPQKLGSQGKNTSFELDTPIIRFVCYHVPTLLKEDIRMNGLGTMFMSDRYTQLSLVSKGYSSLVNCRYAINDPGTGSPGGCQDTRTVELQSEAALKLKEAFPDWVEVVTKEGGKTWNETRLDCKINWRHLSGGEVVKITLAEMEEQYGIKL